MTVIKKRAKKRRIGAGEKTACFCDPQMSGA